MTGGAPPPSSLPRIRDVNRLLAIVVLVAGQVGCSGARPERVPGGRPDLCVSVELGANGDLPVAVDVVGVYEERLAAALTELPAETWFDQRAQLQLDHSGHLQVRSFEWVPGTPPTKVWLELRAGLDAIVLFASYSQPVPRRHRIEPGKSFRLDFGASDVSVTPLEAPCR